jgi:hypothetical protein
MNFITYSILMSFIPFQHNWLSYSLSYLHIIVLVSQPHSASMQYHCNFQTCLSVLGLVHNIAFRYTFRLFSGYLYAWIEQNSIPASVASRCVTSSVILWTGPYSLSYLHIYSVSESASQCIHAESQCIHTITVTFKLVYLTIYYDSSRYCHNSDIRHLT